VNHRLLLALREAEARFDLSSAVAIGATPSSSVTKKKTGAPVGAYHVTYLDEDTLIGRANGAGGHVHLRQSRVNRFLSFPSLSKTRRSGA
jgi:hypothetical protein